MEVESGKWNSQFSLLFLRFEEATKNNSGVPGESLGVVLAVRVGFPVLLAVRE